MLYRMLYRHLSTFPPLSTPGRLDVTMRLRGHGLAECLDYPHPAGLGIRIAPFDAGASALDGF
jgi:hypothetical protein